MDMNIITSYLNDSNFKLEIAQCIYLPTQHCISIIKTFWLKIIQRKWKNIYKERKSYILKRTNLNAIKYKEIYGRWPLHYAKYPLLKGMLSDLSRCSFASPT